MSKKSKNKNVPKKSAPKKSPRGAGGESVEVSADAVAAMGALLASWRSAMSNPIDARKELLARVAGTIAAGLVTSPSPSIASPSGMATAAVDIAEEILTKVGLPMIEPVAAPVPAVEDLGAAS
jgi:hypothetical protein